MPKNEGARGKIQEHLSGSANLEPPEEHPPTYAELNINKKDASIWQFMAEHEADIKAEIEKAKGGPNSPNSRLTWLTSPYTSYINQVKFPAYRAPT